MLLKQSCGAGNSASEMLSQICANTNCLGTKTTLVRYLASRRPYVGPCSRGPHRVLRPKRVVPFYWPKRPLKMYEFKKKSVEPFFL